MKSRKRNHSLLSKPPILAFGTWNVWSEYGSDPATVVDGELLCCAMRGPLCAVSGTQMLRRVHQPEQSAPFQRTIVRDRPFPAWWGHNIKSEFYATEPVNALYQ